MPDWSSTAEVTLDATAFLKFMHAMLGLYIWEWAISLDFEWSFVTGKRKFKWPLIFYFAGRYLLLGAMVGIAVALDSINEVNCQSLYTFNQLSGQAALGLASINLSLRTIAVWGNNKTVIGFLVLIILGHWSLILQGVLLKAEWVPGTGCVITQTNNTILAATFIYSMTFDLIVLLLNVYKLAIARTGGQTLRKGSTLGQMIFGDGLIFFFIAFLSNLIATIFMIMNLNAIMNVIFNVPAAIASTIVASRAVRRLTNFGTQQPDVYAATSSASGVRSQGRALAAATSRRPGVHVQMETFSRAEEARDADFQYNLDKHHYGDDIETKAAL